MAGDVEVCGVCSDNFIVSAKCIKCDFCKKCYHPSCVNIRDSWYKFLTENSSLFWFCDHCKNLWRSNKVIDENLVPNECETLRKEVECLNREKELLNNLISELKYSNETQKALISTYQNRVVDKSSGLSSPNQPRNSYSEVAKTQKSVKSILVIKNQNQTVPIDAVYEEVTKTLNPASVEARINGTKKIRGGVVIDCDSEDSLKKIKDGLNEKLGNKYDINVPKMFKPRLIVKDVRVCDYTNNEEVIKNIVALNGIGESAMSEIKIITHLKYFNKINLIIEVSPMIRKMMLEKQFIFIGWKKSYVSDYLRIIQCYKCYGYGHVEKECRGTLTCSKCTEGHKFNACKSINDVFINCVNHNKKLRKTVPVDHSVKSKDCPIYLNYLSVLKQRIDYGENL
ncbi:uncharacterized protein LOC115878599 [Sitophilus oryzae]|uniref:Uncharacterized protein LOC115878599 n=1 Tax=Sitophilus oryzae TaxID=7048 RepID=A0A6J2XHT0_SITOR|nr:uncharacterized protein LOC115878599 [Sitophilus oryzae]